MRMWMIGDHLESLLKFIGITKSRVEAVSGKPCGCDGRKRRLNSFGMKVFAFKINTIESIKSSECCYRLSVFRMHQAEAFRVLVFGDSRNRH